MAREGLGEILGDRRVLLLGGAALAAWWLLRPRDTLTTSSPFGPVPVPVVDDPIANTRPYPYPAAPSPVVTLDDIRAVGMADTTLQGWGIAALTGWAARLRESIVGLAAGDRAAEAPDLQAQLGKVNELIARIRARVGG